MINIICIMLDILFIGWYNQTVNLYHHEWTNILENKKDLHTQWAAIFHLVAKEQSTLHCHIDRNQAWNDKSNHSGRLSNGHQRVHETVPEPKDDCRTKQIDGHNRERIGQSVNQGHQNVRNDVF